MSVAPRPPAPPPRRDDADHGRLDAVVCPLTPSEIGSAIANIAVWEARLHPRRPDEVANGRPPPRFVFSLNVGSDEALVAPLRAAWARTHHVRRSFAPLEILFCDLDPERDYYERDSTMPSAHGHKSGPNLLFRETMRRLQPAAGFVFLMETDCHPMRPGWLSGLERVPRANADAWVVGAHYAGASPLPPYVARHLNGNALYNLADTRFWLFFEQMLWPWMVDNIREINPDLAYDCAWEAYINHDGGPAEGHGAALVARRILHRFRPTAAIVNIGGWAEQTGRYAWTADDVLAEFPDACVVHGPIKVERDHLRGRARLGRPFVDPTATLGPDRIAFAAAGGPDASKNIALVTRSLWLAGEDLLPGDTIAVSLAIGTPQPGTLAVELVDEYGHCFDHGLAWAGEAPVRPRFDLVVEGRHSYVSLVFRYHLGDATIDAALNVTDIAVRIEREGAALVTILDLLA